MNSRRKVFMARNKKTNFHSLFEVVPSGYRQSRLGTLDTSTFNKLIQWKNVDELVAVLEETGPLIASETCKGAGRMITIREAVSVAEANGHGQKSQGFCPNDPAFLRMQLYLDGRNGFYPSKASVARACAKHGLIESQAFEELRQWAEEDPEAMVAVEPVADLVLARNLCSLALRIVSNYQNEGMDDVLEASGFRHVRRSDAWWVDKELRDSYYVIPFQHNTAIDDTVNFTWKWGKNVFAYEVINQLNHLIYETGSKEVKHRFGPIESAELLASPTVTGKGMPILNKGHDYENEDTRLYLAICDDVPQRRAAEKFIEGIGEMAVELSSVDEKRPVLLGWDFSQIPPIASNAAPEPVFRTLFAAMVGTVLYRDGKIPVACKTCGNAFFDKPKGKRREYCSASCRTAYSSQYAVANSLDSAAQEAQSLDGGSNG